MSDRDHLPQRVDWGTGVPAAAGEHMVHPAYAEESGGPNPFSPKRILRSVGRYKWLVVALTLAGGATALYATRYLELSYTAASRLWIEVVTRNDAMRGPIRSSELLQNDAWLELLRSNAVLDSVVVQAQLYVRHAAQDADVLAGLEANPRQLVPGDYTLSATRDGQLELRSQDGTVVERVRRGDAMGSSLGLSWRPSLNDPSRTVAFTLVSAQEAAGDLNRRLDARLARGGNFMWISYTAADPQRAARVVNTVATRYVEVAAELKRAKLDELRDILERQLEFAEGNLKEAELALERFRVATITLPSETPVAAGLDETRAPVMSAFFDLKLERDALMRDRTAIQRALGGRDGVSVDALSAIPTVRQSPELMQALSSLATKRAERRALLLQYTEEHPQVVRASEDVQELERQTVPTLAQRLIGEMGQQLGQIDGLVGSASEELRQIPTRAIDQARYRREVMTAENLFNDLRQRYESARLAAETAVPDVRVLDAAHPPRTPSMDQRLMLLLSGIAGSLALGLLLAVGLDRMDPRLRYADQVSEEMGVTIIGAVPNLAPPRRLGRLRNGNGKSVVAAQARPEVLEALRAIRLNLMHAYGSAGPMIVTVTSPGAGDGKTFMTSNLALMYADLGYRVLVIDGDTRRGCLHRMFDTDRRPGLTEYLGGTAALDAVTRTTSYASVDMIPSGARLPNAPELLSSPLLGDMLGSIRSEYDVILIDSPPLGAGIDPLVLGSLSGNILLVMRTGNTERAIAEAKLRMLDRLPVRVLGTVLNGFDSGEAYRYYSYMPGYEAGDEQAATPAVLQRG